MPEEAHEYWFSGRYANVGGKRQMRTQALLVTFGYTLQIIDAPIEFGALVRKAKYKATA